MDAKLGRQRGYMMLVLMLAVALMSIALLTVLPAIRLQVQRDRELELQHRGTAYMRAIQHYYKKFNRYPTRAEELENTNNLRFLRKHYLDPVNRDPATGKEREFRFLHQQDVQMSGFSLQQVPGQIPGLSPGQNPGLNGQLGQSPFGQTGVRTVTQAQNADPAQKSSDTAAEGESDAGNAGGGASDAGSNSGSGQNQPQPSNPGSGLGGQTFGGGPILGVASTSKAKSVRIFFEKNHYKDWLFIYVSGADRGGLLVGPVNPNAMAGGNLGGLAPGVGGGALNQNGGPIPGPGLPNAGPQIPQPPQTPGQGGSPDNQ